MKLTFNSAVIGDDAPAAGERRTIQVLNLSGASLVQGTPLAGGAHPSVIARGNVSGQVSFAVNNTFASVDLANAFLPAEYARLNTQADLIWQRASDLFTFPNAVLSQIGFALQGVKVTVQYTFTITSVTIP